MAKKILIAEDDADIQEMYLLVLRRQADILQAFTVEDARTLFFRYAGELVVVVFDGELNGSTTVALAAEAKKHPDFRGVLIASSGCKGTQAALMAAGCDHGFPKPVGVELIDLIETLLA